MNNSVAKISFLGDIMCELPLLRAYKRSGDKVFYQLFEDTAALLENSDFVVGNLETVCAGRNMRYTNELYSFNTPDSFLDVIKKSPIDLVLLANNHCFDRGEFGLERTINELKVRGIQYCGASLKKDGTNNLPIFDIGDVRVSFYSLTESTNYYSNRVLAKETTTVKLNTMRDNNRNVYSGAIYPREQNLKQKKRMFNEETRIRIKKLFGREYNWERSDDFLDETALTCYLSEIKKEITYGNNNSDVTIVCPHMGGQFNRRIGNFSSYMMEKFVQYGADAVIASHPHIVQCANYIKNVPIFYSLGNFSMSPSSVYLLNEGLPQYGIIAHLYISNKKIDRTTFSVVMIQEKFNHSMRIIPITEITNITSRQLKEISQIVNTVRRSPDSMIEIQSEYDV